jgi:hypothetical protein
VKKLSYPCLASIVAAIFFLLFPVGTFAQDQFLVDSKVTYTVSEAGITQVSHEISLENNFSTLYATSYTVSLESIDAQNVRVTQDDGKILSSDSSKEGDITTIKIAFDDALVGKGKVRHFTISYDNYEFAVRTGEVWEISIPKLASSENFGNYQTILRVPDSFGFEAYISPHPDSQENIDGYKIYSFSKDKLLLTGVTAGFGDFQVFSYTLNYHLENPLPKYAQTEIAIPPDTAFQKVYLRSLDPAPSHIKLDPDGNWLAVYNLKPRERVDIVAVGDVQIFSSERSFPKPTQETLQKNLAPTDYWQSDDTEIKALAAKLKTPRAIYDYVSNNLKYSYERVTPNVERLGAKGALLSPNNAICMEYTDLFIAIARAAGIPAREVNGYAYTENPDIQPLSLVADVLHSWPEYWDSERGAWIPIDPTWASTTGGINFFDKLDLRHFTFVIHGEDSLKPYPPGSYKLGSNPQKDVYVSFGKISEDIQNYPEITARMKNTLPFLYSYLDLTLKNTGETAFYSLMPTVYFDKSKFYEDFVEVLLPYSSYSQSVKIPYSFLGKNTPDKISIEAGGTSISIPTNKENIILTSLLGLFIAFIVILLAILWKSRKLQFQKLLGSIRFGKPKNQSMSVKP